jgi:hypothetical protein
LSSSSVVIGDPGIWQYGFPLKTCGNDEIY